MAGNFWHIKNGIVFPAGAVSTPTLTWSGDEDTGAYWVSSNRWALVAGGSTTLDLQQSGITIPGRISSAGASLDSLALFRAGVNGSSPLTGATGYGFATKFFAPATMTTIGGGFLSELETAASAFTLSFGANFIGAGITSLGAGSTVTRFAGLRLTESSLATNNALITDSTSFTAGNWAINLASVRANAFGGDLRTSGSLVAGFTSSPGTDVRFYSFQDVTGVTNGLGNRIETRFAQTSGSSALGAANMFSQLLIKSTNTQNWTNTGEGLASIRGDFSVQSGASGTISLAECFYAGGSLAASSVTISKFSVFTARAFSVSAGTVTGLVGFNVQNQTGGTNNVNILSGQSNHADAVPTGNWGVYEASTKPNFFNGASAQSREDVASAATIAALSSTKGFVKLTGSTATTIQGIAAGKDGQIIRIYNSTGQNMTISHQNGTATAADRIITMTGADIATTGDGFAELIYDTNQSRWIAMYVTA